MHGSSPRDESWPDPDQMKVWNTLDAAARLAIVDDLRRLAIDAKRASLRASHPGLDEAAIDRAAKRWFLFGFELEDDA